MASDTDAIMASVTKGSTIPADKLQRLFMQKIKSRQVVHKEQKFEVQAWLRDLFPKRKSSAPTASDLHSNKTAEPPSAGTTASDGSDIARIQAPAALPVEADTAGVSAGMDVEGDASVVAAAQGPQMESSGREQLDPGGMEDDADVQAEAHPTVLNPKQQDQGGTGEEAAGEDKLEQQAKVVAAAAALEAARVALSGVVPGSNTVEVREVRDFAGEQVEVVRSLPANYKAASVAKRKAEMQACTTSGLDALLQQLEKRKKLNILDKSRKDWSEFKEETGVTEELEEYKKSGARYTEKVDFLQRAELREYERERDAKLQASTVRRRPATDE